MLSVEFQHVDAHINGTQQEILVSHASESVSYPLESAVPHIVRFLLVGRKKQVCWKWAIDRSTSVNEISTSEEENLEDEESDGSYDLTQHPLPFKVMGIPYSAE